MLKLRRLSKREHAIVVVTALVLTVGVIYSFVVEPIVARWTELHAIAEESEQHLMELRGLAANRDYIEREYAHIREAIRTQKDDQDPMLGLFAEVDELARTAGLDVGNVRPLPPKRDGRFERIGVEVSARGEAYHLVRFLYALQTAEHLLNAETLTLTANRTTPPITVTVTITKLRQSAGDDAHAS